MRIMKDITIRKIADLCGVSASTVSNILNDKSSMYSEEVRQKVLRVIKDTGYRHRKHRKRIRLITVQTDSIIVECSFFHGQLLEGIYKSCERSKAVLVLSHVLHSEWSRAVEAFSSSPCDGMIVLGTILSQDDLQLLRSFSVPCVVVDSGHCGQWISSVSLNNEDAIYELTGQIIASRHRYIGFVGGNDGISNYRDRKQGFLRALADHRIEHNPVYDIPADSSGRLSWEQIQERLSRIMKLPNPPTAYCAVNDYIAIEFQKAAAELGYSFSLTGFDDLQNFPAGTVPVTSAHINQMAMGETAAELLIQLIDNPEIKPVKIFVSSSIVEKHSVHKCTKHF